MTRYRALRLLGCDWLTAALIAGLNEACGVPLNEIRIMGVVVELDSEVRSGQDGAGGKR